MTQAVSLNGRNLNLQKLREALVGGSRVRFIKDLVSRGGEEQAAKSLGWFSIGLGLAELLTPQMVASLVGLKGTPILLIRLFGLREIASGIGIFSQGKRPTAALWSRVGGDALDIAALGIAFLSPKTRKKRLLFALGNVLAVTALDVLTAERMSKKDGSITEDGAVRVRRSVVINRTPEELYALWQDFEKFPTFMRHLVSVQKLDEKLSRWVAKSPGGGTVEWLAETTHDKPNELIAWQSLPGSAIENKGSVSFEKAAGQRGSVLRVDIEYKSPAGVAGSGIAKLFREEPAQ
jgi:uncharacterized membrane protein